MLNSNLYLDLVTKDTYEYFDIKINFSLFTLYILVCLSF